MYKNNYFLILATFLLALEQCFGLPTGIYTKIKNCVVL